MCHYICHRITRSKVLAHAQWLNVGSPLHPVEFFSVELFFYNYLYFSNELFYPEIKSKRKVSISSFVTNRLSTYEKQCISRQNFIDFDEEYFKFCIHDCYLDVMNESIYCLYAFELICALIFTSIKE